MTWSLWARHLGALGVCLATATIAVAQQADDEERPGRRGRDRGAPSEGDDFGDEGGPGGAGGRGGRGGRGGEAGEDGEPGGPGGGRGFGREGGRGFGGRGGGQNLLFDALDTDSDGEISLAELRKAVANIKKLDRDNDEVITREEAGIGRGMGGRFGGDPAQMVERWLENDANGDGVLQEEEVPEFMARMLSQADSDGDGELTREELTAAAAAFGQRFGGGPGGPGGFGGGGPGGGPNPQQMIQQFDRNGDGLLQADEVPPQMMGMLRGGDANGDGAIDAQEFARIGERMRGGGRGGPGGGRGGEGGGRGGEGGFGGGRGGEEEGAEGGRGGRGRPQAEDEEDDDQ